jgi:hypothetical protein
MSETITIACQIHFEGRGRGNRRRLERGPEPAPRPPGRVPRVSRLLALALRLDEQVRRGDISNYAEVAALGHVTRARVSQIIDRAC